MNAEMKIYSYNFAIYRYGGAWCLNIKPELRMRCIMYYRNEQSKLKKIIYELSGCLKLSEILKIN